MKSGRKEVEKIRKERKLGRKRYKEIKMERI